MPMKQTYLLFILPVPYVKRYATRLNQYMLATFREHITVPWEMDEER